MKFFSINFFLVLLFVLLSIAFFTLLERKILGYSHNRFGPNKVSFFGLFQPISDVLKLFSKDDFKVKEVGFIFFVFSSFFCVFLNILMWGLMPFWGFLFYCKYVLLLIIVFIGMGVYFLLFMGWCSDTKYSLLGSYRSSSQSISYEVVMVFCILFFVFMFLSLDYTFLFNYSIFYNLGLYAILLFFCWFVSCLAESNRSPFDFSEGESELVSGFNTEYGGGFFSFIFIGEYSSIISLSFMSSFFFFNFFYMVVMVFLFSFFYLWIRCSFPRLRYDFLMMMAWKGIIFLILCYFFLWVFLF